MFFIVRTAVGVIQTLCSEAETPFCASEILVSMTETAVDEASNIFSVSQIPVCATKNTFCVASTTIWIIPTLISDDDKTLGNKELPETIDFDYIFRHSDCNLDRSDCSLCHPEDVFQHRDYLLNGGGCSRDHGDYGSAFQTAI
jgi:hypothetical protein